MSEAAAPSKSLVIIISLPWRMPWCQKPFSPNWLRWIQKRRLCTSEKAFSFAGLWCLIPLGSWMSENKQMQPFSQEGKVRNSTASWHYLFIRRTASAHVPAEKSNHCSLVEQLPLTEEKHLDLTLVTEQLEALLNWRCKWVTLFSSKFVIFHLQCLN